MKGTGFGKILFAVDGSSHMRAAAYSVARLAHATNSEVILRHVLSDGPRTAGATDLAIEPPAWMDQIARVVANANVRTTLQTRLATADERAETIVVAAKQLDVGLIALGSRGLSDLSDLFRSSVSHQVIARSDCPGSGRSLWSAAPRWGDPEDPAGNRRRRGCPPCPGGGDDHRLRH